MGRHHKFGRCNKDCITQFFVKFILLIVKTQIHYLIDQFAVTLTKEDCSFAFCSHKEILHYTEHFFWIMILFCFEISENSSPVEVVDKKDVLNSEELEESFEFSQQVISHCSVCYFTVISKVTL